MLAGIKVEWLKLRRSRISLITTVLVGIGVPALTAGFLAAATRGPADTPLAIKVNALLIGEGWPAYLGMLAQILSVMSFLGVGFVVAWCFGREFTDHTITGLYALPTSRDHDRRRQVRRPARLVPGPQPHHPGRRVRTCTLGRSTGTAN